MFDKLTQFDLHHRIAEQQSPSLVFFTSKDCGACQHLKAILTSVAQSHPEWRIFEIDAQRDMALTREFEVFHLPSLFLFANGEFHSPLACEARVSAIETAVLAALEQPPQEAP